MIFDNGFVEINNKIMAQVLDNHYFYVHKWLMQTHGKASRCELCDGKKAKRFEWALKRGFNYEKKLENFLQLCPSCHRKYDFTEETRRNMSLNAFSRGKFGGSHATAKKIYSIDRTTGNKEYFDSIEDAIKKYPNYKHPNISMNLTGKNPSAYNKWWYYQ